MKLIINLDITTNLDRLGAQILAGELNRLIESTVLLVDDSATFSGYGGRDLIEVENEKAI